MRQTIPLTHPRHKPPQALDQVKKTVNKYLKRERRKPLPDGADFWDFDCRVGLDEPGAQPTHVSAVNKAIDALAADGATAVYVEILARPATRQKRPGES